MFVGIYVSKKKYLRKSATSDQDSTASECELQKNANELRIYHIKSI